MPFVPLVPCVAATPPDAPPSIAYTWRPAVITGGGFVTGIGHRPAARDVAYVRTDVGDAYRLSGQV